MMKDQTNTKTLRVEELERFGTSILDMPKEAFEGQGKIIFAAFRRKFGLVGMVPFAWRVLMKRRRLLRCYAQEYRELCEITPDRAREITMLMAMFNVITNRESREQAYALVKGIVVDRCINVEPGKMFDCQEIAKLGCDHDPAGYLHVEPLVNAEFRRPCTLTKGDSCCEFNFYRAGFVPAWPYDNK